MGSRNADRVHISQWKSKAPTIADMWRGGWKIRSYCESCSDERLVNLDAMIRAKGPGHSLWDCTTVCPRIVGPGSACRGRVFYKGRPQSGAHFDFLGHPPRTRRPVHGPLAAGRDPFISADEIEPSALLQALGPAPPDPDGAQ